MMLMPDSLNEPFGPIFIDYQTGRRSRIPEDYNKEELEFFECILDSLEEPWLKARLADLLWLCRAPKNPDHARVAIRSYLAHPINSKSWNRDVGKCWERAARLAMQIGEREKIDDIKNKLFEAFKLEYPDCIYMPFWLARHLDRLNLDFEFRESMAIRLFELGVNLKDKFDFDAARSYLDLAARKFEQSSDEEGRVESLLSIADCFEKEGDSRLSGSNLVANSFYENAIQAYRRVPTKHRDDHDFGNKIQTIRAKITSSGKASLEEMALVKSPTFDISEMAEAAIAHVAGKSSLEEALLYFVGLYPGPKYQCLVSSARESIRESPLLSILATSHISEEGRIVAKTPAANFDETDDSSTNKAVLSRQVHQVLKSEIQMVVEGGVLPGLRQILMEHRITKEFLGAVCHQSPIVPEGRARLLAFALWLGFEYDFGNAIHLLCPQIENIVRVQLKEFGALTSNIDREGIENENGLSALMDLPESKDVFGSDLAFEIESVFTDALGFNLRNEVAHGLLNDNSSSLIATVYAWWMSLRLVFNSLAGRPLNETGKNVDIEEYSKTDNRCASFDKNKMNDCVVREVTSGAFTQVVVEKAGRVMWRSSLELTGSDKHYANRSYPNTKIVDRRF